MASGRCQARARRARSHATAAQHREKEEKVKRGMFHIFSMRSARPLFHSAVYMLFGILHLYFTVIAVSLHVHHAILKIQ
jgi:hypothetical protein